MKKAYLQNFTSFFTIAILVLIMAGHPHQAWGADETASTTQQTRQQADQKALEQDKQRLEQNRQGNIDQGRNPYSIVDEEECLVEDDDPNGEPGGGDEGGPFVPVHEVGELLRLSRSTNQEIIQSRILQQQLCLNLKSIRRIQLSMEYKTFIEDPNRNRQAATDNTTYVKGILMLIKQGYKDSPTSPAQGSSPLYIENLEAHVIDKQKEQAGILEDWLKENKDNPFLDRGLKVIAQMQTVDNLDPDVTADEIDSYSSGETVGKEGMIMLGKITSDPFRNIPYLWDVSVRDQLESRQAIAKDLALSELQQNNGFLPIRECVTTTANGKDCIQWKNTTPGILSQGATYDALRSRLDQYINNPTEGIVGPDNGPSAAEVATLTPGGSGDSGIIPGGGADRNGNSGSDGRGGTGSGGGNIPCIIPGIFPPGCGSGSNGDGGDGDSGDGDQTPSDAPTINAHFTTPTLAQINSGTPNISKLFWNVSGRGNVTCTADNVWLTGSTTPGISEIIFNMGATLPKNQDAGLAIRHPLAFTLTTTHNNNPTIADLSSFYDGNLLSQFSLYVPGGDGTPINFNDTFSLTFTKSDGLTQAIAVNLSSEWQTTPPSAARIVSLFKTAIDSALAGGDPELQKYQFDYTIGDLASPSGIGLLSISTNPIYKIKCQNEAGITKKVITIGR